jgi:hypothetical protein
MDLIINHLSQSLSFSHFFLSLNFTLHFSISCCYCCSCRWNNTLCTADSKGPITQMICEYRERRWNDTDRRKPKNLEKTLSECHFVHHKSLMDWPGSELWPPRWDASDKPRDAWHGLYISLPSSFLSAGLFISKTYLNIIFLGIYLRSRQFQSHRASIVGDR